MFMFRKIERRGEERKGEERREKGAYSGHGDEVTSVAAAETLAHQLTVVAGIAGHVGIPDWPVSC